MGVRKKRGEGYAGEDKKDKMRGGGGVGGVVEKNLRGGMPGRVKKTKCGGCEKKIEGGMPEKVQKTKCRGGVLRIKIEGEYR